MARTIPDPTEYIPGSSKRAGANSLKPDIPSIRSKGQEVRQQQRHELRHDRRHTNSVTTGVTQATGPRPRRTVATLLDDGTAVHGEGHSRGHVQSGTRRVAQKIRANHSVR